MPLNGYSAGRDVTTTIVTSKGPLKFSQITGFHSKSDTVTGKVKKVNGVTDHWRFPDGWTGGFDIERADSTADDYFAQLEADYYAGLNELPGTITETITEVDGSVSQFRYTGVLLTLDDAGNKTGNGTIQMKVSFVASTRLKVA